MVLKLIDKLTELIEALTTYYQVKTATDIAHTKKMNEWHEERKEKERME